MGNSSSNSLLGPIFGSLSSSTPQIDPKVIAYIDAKVKPKTPLQMRAHSDYILKLGVLILVGIILIGLLIVGVIIYFHDSAAGGTFWDKIIPILTAGIMGPLGFLAGEKKSNS